MDFRCGGVHSLVRWRGMGLRPGLRYQYELVNKDISSLSYLLYMIEAEKPCPEERPDPYDWRDAEAIIR